MIALSKELYAAALARYLDGSEYFPLIAAVLHDLQDGVVYADDAVRPQQFYVEHAFGFAQVFGMRSPAFEGALESYLFVTRDFTAPKVRLYGLDAPAFLSKPAYSPFLSTRQRFRHSGAASSVNVDRTLAVVAVGEGNIAAVQRDFGVVTRFWRTPSDFVRYANARVVTHDGEAASICYAAALTDARAEIDVLTMSSKRRAGAARVAVSAFIQRCAELAVEPLWDCFVNNEGSIGLAHAMGFRPSRAPYPFFTISRAGEPAQRVATVEA